MNSLSVVIPTYENDDPDDLTTALQSVLNQTLPPDEVIVIGDGPLSDGIEDVIDEYETEYPDVVQLHQLSENQGKGKARQVGVKQASEKIVAMMDADDVCCKDRFEKQSRFLDENPGVDVVGSYVTEFDPNTGESYGIRTVPETHEEIASMARYRSPLNQATVMFRRKAVLAVGNYEDVRLLEDYRLWVRLLVDRAKFANIPESLVKVRAGKDMQERRGGWQYAKSEIRMEYDFYRWGFIPLWLAVLNAIARVALRTVPNSLRGTIYSRLFRKGVSEV